MVITTAILQITRVYYRGITETKTQNATRSIIDVISQGIQFNGGNITTTPASPTPGTSYAFCVGGKQFSYTTGYQLTDGTAGTNQSNHVLMLNGVAGCTSSSPAQNVTGGSVSGRELMEPGMRLSNIQVSMVSANVYKVQVRVVSGDDDVLNNPTATNASCKGLRIGSQFCAVSELTTTVVKRVQ
jgi:hypothetical protein